MPRRVPEQCETASPEEAHAAREQELRRLMVGRSDLDAPLDRIVREAAEVFGTPYAAFTVLDRDYAHLRARVGLEFERMPRVFSFCDAVVETGEMIVVPDAERHARFGTLPVVAGPPHIRFHAAAPVKTAAGRCIGTLFVSDVTPRRATSARLRRRLAFLAQAVADLIEARGAAPAPAAPAPQPSGDLSGMLTALAVEAHAAATPQAAVQRCVESILSFTGWEAGYAWLVRPDGELEAIAPAPYGPDLARRALEAQTFLAFHDLAALGDVPAAKEAIADKRRRWFGVPIRDEGRIALVLEFYAAAAALPHDLFPAAITPLDLIVSRVFERARSSEALEGLATQVREQTEFLQKVFDNIDAGVLVSFGDAIVVANNQFRQLFELPRNVCPVGLDLRTLITSQAALKASPVTPELGDLLDDIATWMGGPQDGPYEIAGFNGRVYELRQRRTPSDRLVGTVRDVTEQRNAYERTHQSQKMEALGELAGGVAHEFNNMLLVISGFAATAMKRAEDPAEVRSAVEEILAASGRASELASQMLTFSRNWVGEGRVIELGPALDQLRRPLSMQGRGLRVEIDVEPGLRVEVDRSHFVQALLNLALNARDSMSRGGLLEITARRIVAAEEIRSRYGAAALPRGEYAQIVVRDTGAGIPPDVLPRIFEPFFTTKGPGQGTGLGLSFVFGVVKQAGGLIDVRSSVGRGTAFTLHLPISAKPVSATANDTEYVGGTETVLLIDDEPQVRKITRSCFEDLGYSVVEAASALEALDLFDEHRDEIDLVLTDVMMPDMDGFELADVLREIGCRAEIGFMTGCVPDLERDSARFERANILKKPFSIKDIALFSRRLLEAREAA